MRAIHSDYNMDVCDIYNTNAIRIKQTDTQKDFRRYFLLQGNLDVIYIKKTDVFC